MDDIYVQNPDSVRKYSAQAAQLLPYLTDLFTERWQPFSNHAGTLHYILQYPILQIFVI